MAMSSDPQNHHGLTERGAPDHDPALDRSKRGRLLKAAAAVVTHGGYRNATVEQILEHAGASWSDFTDEFGSLEECCLAAQAAALECAALQVESAVLRGGTDASPEILLDAALRDLLETIAAHGQFARLALVESAYLGARGMECKEAGLQRFVTLFQELATASGVAIPPLAAEMVAGGIYEILQRKVASNELDRPADLAKDLRRLWLPLIGPGTPRK